MPAVSPEILSWARDRAGLSKAEAARKLAIKAAYGKTPLERLTELESGDREPTRPLVLRMAAVYRQPLITFYLAQPPEPSLHDSEFRSLSGSRSDQARIDTLVRDMQASQGLVHEILADEDAPRVPFIGTLTLDQGVDHGLSKVRELLGDDGFMKHRRRGVPLQWAPGGRRTCRGLRHSERQSRQPSHGTGHDRVSRPCADGSAGAAHRHQRQRRQDRVELHARARIRFIFCSAETPVPRAPVARRWSDSVTTSPACSCFRKPPSGSCGQLGTSSPRTWPTLPGNGTSAERWSPIDSCERGTSAKPNTDGWRRNFINRGSPKGKGSGRGTGNRKADPPSTQSGATAWGRRCSNWSPALWRSVHCPPDAPLSCSASSRRRFNPCWRDRAS